MDRMQAIQLLLKAVSEASMHSTAGRTMRHDAIDALEALDVSETEITAALRHAWAEEMGR